MSSRHLLTRREHLFYSIISAVGYEPLIAIFIIGLGGKKMNLVYLIWVVRNRFQNGKTLHPTLN